jgi:hypothetical protein
VVTELTPTETGFQVTFNNEIDTADLNLCVDSADVELIGATSGPVVGSLVISDRSVEFIKTGDPLVADTYTATLFSAADAFEDTGGLLLDGNGDGTGGDDYNSTFVVGEPAANTVTVSIPDFVRGPGQDVNLPANTTTGIPISISEGNNVRSIEFRIDYDSGLLEITAATAGAALPGSSLLTLDNTVPGLAIVSISTTDNLPAGPGTVVNLTAIVPTDNASENYRRQQVLDLNNVVVDTSVNSLPVIENDGLHVVTYPADVTANGRINAADAASIARNAALLDSGFARTPSTDPSLLGDVSGNLRVNAADASLTAQFAALIPVAVIPPIPGGIVISGLLWLGSNREESAEADRGGNPQVIHPGAIALEFTDDADLGMADADSSVNLLVDKHDMSSHDAGLTDLLDEIFLEG